MQGDQYDTYHIISEKSKPTKCSFIGLLQKQKEQFAADKELDDQMISTFVFV